MSFLTPLAQKHFPRLYRWITLRMVRERFEDAPFHPLEKPLNRCRLALVTTGGFHLESQPPFRTKALNECSFREIPLGAPAKTIRISHDHYDHTAARKDLNVLLPRDPFRELAEKQVIGGITKTIISFMGAIVRPRQLIQETAPAAGKRLRELGTDAALITPA